MPPDGSSSRRRRPGLRHHLRSGRGRARGPGPKAGSRVGYANLRHGPYAAGRASPQAPTYTPLGQYQVNAACGWLAVKGAGRRPPIECVLDRRSERDRDSRVRFLREARHDDKVDLNAPPWGSP